MTAWRVGVAIKPETEYGKLNEDPNEPWHYVGVGMDFLIKRTADRLIEFKEPHGERFKTLVVGDVEYVRTDESRCIGA